MIFKGDPRVLKRCFKGVPRVFQKVFQGSFKKTFRVFQKFHDAWHSSQLPEQKEGLCKLEKIQKEKLS